jgi:hypothetical protein
VRELDFDYGDKTIQEFVLLFRNGQLNLEPGFQRDSVWATSDRKKLIESIFQNYPIPSVFLYKRNNRGKLEYDVIDGKQRLESVLMYCAGQQDYVHQRIIWRLWREVGEAGCTAAAPGSGSEAGAVRRRLRAFVRRTLPVASIEL